MTSGVATRSLLTLEGISVTLIVILVVVIFVPLIVGSAPAGHSASLGDAFDLPSGTSLDAIATASVFGFLSFAGFEGAAALGEETDQPRRNIPRAVFLAPLSMGVFYFFVILSQTLGSAPAKRAWPRSPVRARPWASCLSLDPPR